MSTLSIQLFCSQRSKHQPPLDICFVFWVSCQVLSILTRYDRNLILNEHILIKVMVILAFLMPVSELYFCLLDVDTDHYNN